MWNQCKRDKHVEGNEAERSWRSEDFFVISSGDAKFGNVPACFLSFFGLVLSQYSPFPPFGNSNIYPMPLCAANMCSFFILILQGLLELRDCLKS